MIKNISTKSLGDLVSAVKKPFASVSDEATEAMGKMWGKAGKKAGGEAAEQAAKQADNVSSELAQILAERGPSAKVIEESLTNASSQMNYAVRSATKALKEAKHRKDMIMQNFRVSKSKLPPDDIKGMNDLEHQLQERLVELDDDIKISTLRLQEMGILSDLMRKYRGTGNFQFVDEALRRFNASSNINALAPHMQGWDESAAKALREINAVRSIRSKNLGNDTALLREVLKLKRSNPEKLKLWKSNPDNYRMLEKLEDKNYLRKIFERGYLTTREKITGVTPKDWAKRLGLTTGLSAGAAGAVGIYNWFADNDPAQTASAGKEIKVDFGVSGNAESIRKQTTASLNKITAISNKANAMMSRNPGQATSFYVEHITRELVVLSQLLNKWNVVINNSDNPAEAQKTYSTITKFADSLANQIHSLSGQVGVDLKGTATKDTKKDANIAKVQNALGINATGVLDQQTISALQGLENRYNEKTGDSVFTGAFVVPEIGFVADYNNIIDASNRIKNYR